MEPTNDDKPITFIAHPPMSAIHLQGVIERYAPDITTPNLLGLIEEIQNLHVKVLNNQ